MSLVELGLGLDLNPFLSQLATAEGALKRIQTQGKAGVTIGARLDTSSIWPSLEAVKKTLAKEKVTLKVATEFYRVGGGNSISAKSLKEGVLRTVQQTVNGSDDYKIKIGTVFKFDQSATKQIKSIIKELDASIERFNAAKAAAASASKPADVGSVRQRLADLTNTESRGGLNAAELRRLQNEASKVGIKTSATGATELRKQLREEFLKAGEDAIKGLAKGLIENPTSVLRASSSLADSLVKALKKDLGIRSPSERIAKEVGKPSGEGWGKGAVEGVVAWERRLATTIRQVMGNAVQQGLARDQAARGALMNFGKDAGATIATSLTKALKQGLSSSIVPAIKGGLVGGAGGFATGGLVGAATAAGGAIKQAVMPAMTTFGYSSMPEKLGMLGKGSVSMVTGQASEAFNQFLQSSVDSVLNAALSSGGQGALLGAAGVAGVAGLAGLAKGTSGSLVSQAVESIKNRITGTAAKAAVQEAAAIESAASTAIQPTGDARQLTQLGDPLKKYKLSLTKAQKELLEYAFQFDNIAEGTTASNLKAFGIEKLAAKMELTAEQLNAIAAEFATNPVIDDISSYADDLGKSSERVALAIKNKLNALTAELNATQISLLDSQSPAAATAAKIGRDLASSAIVQAQAQAQLPGSTTDAVVAPIENAGNVMGLLQDAIAKIAKGVLDFAGNLMPGKVKENGEKFGWALLQAAEQFEILKKDAQALGGKVKLLWTDLEGTTPQRPLPPKPVPGTGLIRERNIQLGDVVGRTATDFGGQYIEQTRKELKGIFGKPGEWKIVDEANGVWQGIKTDSQLARERLRIIANALTTNKTFLDNPKNRYQNNQVTRSRMRVWTDREGVGVFNPFDPPFYIDSNGGPALGRYTDRVRGRDVPRGRTTLGGVFSGGRTNDYYGEDGPIPPEGFRWRRAVQDRPGALALRNVPVEFFTSFRDAERLLAVVEQRLASLTKAFGRLGVVSQAQVDQNLRSLAVSFRAVDLAFRKGEVGATDFAASLYGLQRATAGLEGKSAEVQNLAQAFENLGIQSRAAVEALQDQRNIDLKFIEDTLGSGSSEATRARNARDIQQLNRANDLVRTAQGASGFGGFRGREIGNDILNRAEQRSILANAIREMKEYSQTLKLTETNAKTFQRVQAALNQEISNAERAFAVLNGTAKAGETITNVARNAWGTILDDFKNLVPQLLVFAVAYNLILQRVMGTPGAVIQAAAAFDRLETSISAYLSATRGIGDASGEIDKLRGIALDLGIGFEKAASSYLRFAAATQGTPLQGREADIARTLATAGRNQGLSGEQIDRASVALTQILSKGKVQSEELRGQLAEQLPGSLQIAARAFGVTTKELYRMVEAGQIAGDEFVGKFIAQLKAEGAATNQLAGNFSNVSEQLGSSIQALAAASGEPFLAPLTLALQGFNAVIQSVIPVAPVLTGLFVVLGANALRGALGVKSLTAEIIGASRAFFVGKNPAEGYTAGLVKLTGVARVATGVLATLGKAALIGLAFEAVSGVIKLLKGEIGSLGDELKKVQKIADGGVGQGLNGLQKLLGNLNVAQNISDRVTFFDAAKIGESSEKATKKIIGNQSKIAASLKTVSDIDKALYQERIRRDQAEADKDEAAVNRSIDYIKRLEEARRNVSFDFSPEDAQIQLGVLKAAEQSVEKLIERQKALGNSPLVEQQQLDRLRQAREEFEKAANAVGLLDKAFIKVNSLSALQSQLKAYQEILPTLDVNSDAFRTQQLAAVGLQQAISDQQLLPQERALKTQEAVLRRMSAELKLQENIQRIKLGLVENERKALEASLSLEQTRGRLREAVAQRRVDVANAVNAPEEAMAGEAQLARVRERNQTRELQMRSQILSKDRERVGIETSLQKEQIRLQTQQIKIDKQMLEIERLKLEAAAKVKGVSADLVRAYYLQMGQIDKTLKATDDLVGQEGQLLQSVEQRGAAELNALGIKQQELDVQLELLGATQLTEQQVRQINAAKQDIANKEAAALVTVEAAAKALERQQQTLESQLDVVRATVDAERERAQLAEENAKAEMGLVDRLLELQQGRNDGGFFERLSKASLLGADGEQEAYDLAKRRMDLLRQVQEQQLRQKRLELNFKKQELEAEKALNDLKLKGLRIANEESKISLRRKLEEARLTLVTLGDQATPEQKKLLSEVLGAQKTLGGFNAEGQGNSVNTNIQSLLGQSNDIAASGRMISKMEANQNKVYGERFTALGNLISNEERLLGIQEQLFELDAAQWFGQFLDKSTQLGRTLGVITDGLSEFRTTVSQAFADAIVNGASVSDAVADAGKAFTGKIVTGLVDEAILKPMEANLFKGLSQAFGFQAPQSDQAATAANTGETKQSVDTVNSSVVKLTDVTRSGLAAVEQAIQNIAKPTTGTPTYRQPEDPGMTGVGAATSAVRSGFFGRGQQAYFGETGNVSNGDPNWVHGHLQSTIGSAAQTVEDALRLVRALFKQGSKVAVGNGRGIIDLMASMTDSQIRSALQSAIRQHRHSGGGTALDLWVPKGTPVPVPMTDIRNTPGARGGINGLLPSGKTFMGHLDPKSVNGAAFGPQSNSAIGDQFTRLLAIEGGLATVASAGAVPVQVVGGTTRGWSGESSPIPGGPEPAPLPPVDPLQAPVTTPPVGETFNAYSQGMLTLNDSVLSFTSGLDLTAEQINALSQNTDELNVAFSSNLQAAQQVPSRFQSLSNTIGSFVSLLGGLAMGFAGARQIQQGGAYNTLMGLSGVFGAVSSIAGSIGGIGKLFGGGAAPAPRLGFGATAMGAPLAGLDGIGFRATGGPVRARAPYIVGENGPELFLPESFGTVFSNSRTEALMASRDALQASPAGNSTAAPFDANREAIAASVTAIKDQQVTRAFTVALTAAPKPMDIRYESRVINSVEYVSAEQFQQGLRDAAERGRAMTLSSLRNSVKTRRSVGV